MRPVYTHGSSRNDPTMRPWTGGLVLPNSNTLGRHALLGAWDRQRPTHLLVSPRLPL